MTHEMNKESIRNYRNQLIQEEYAPSTVQTYLRDIQAFAAWVKKNRIQQENPPAGEVCISAQEEQRGKTEAGSGTNPDAGTAKGNREAADARPETVAVSKEITSGWKAYLAGAGYAPVTINGF